MQTKNLCSVLAALLVTAMLSGCSRPADNPYSKIQDPPLVQATLHTATIASPDAGFPRCSTECGLHLHADDSNYPASVTGRGLLWKVPEDLAATPVILMTGAAQGPNLRVLVMPAVAPPVKVDAQWRKAFSAMCSVVKCRAAPA